MTDINIDFEKIRGQLLENIDSNLDLDRKLVKLMHTIAIDASIAAITLYHRQLMSQLSSVHELNDPQDD